MSRDTDIFKRKKEEKEAAAAAEEKKKKDASDKAAEEQRKKEVVESPVQEKGQKKLEEDKLDEDKKVTPEMIEQLLSRVKSLEGKNKNLEETDEVFADAYKHILNSVYFTDGKVDKLTDLFSKFIKDMDVAMFHKVIGEDGVESSHADNGI